MSKFNNFYEKFNTLPPTKRKAFLKTLFDLSDSNKNLFEIWVKNDPQSALKNFIKQIDKETINRIGRYRKIRLSKINEILRAAKEIALPTFEAIQLQEQTWKKLLENILSRNYWPDRYEKACARHLDKYIELVNLHITDKSARDEKLQETKSFLEAIIKYQPYLPNIKETYLKNFDA